MQDVSHPLANKGGRATVAPVIAGLAAGIAFLFVFSNVADSLSTIKNDQTGSAKKAFVILTIAGMDDTYRAGEPISFTLITKGASHNICNYPKPSIQIARIPDEKGVWNTPPTFQTSMGCPMQPFYSEWRFGYSGEDLPFQSALVHDRKYENRIAIEEPGRYKLIALFEDHRAEKEFMVLP